MIFVLFLRKAGYMNARDDGRSRVDARTSQNVRHLPSVTFPALSVRES
jgi:hypothetical protein